MHNDLKGWKVGFMASIDFRSWEAEKVAAALSKIGYEGVEWTLAHFNPTTKTKKELEALIEITKSYGLEISEIVAQQDLVTLDDKARRDGINLITECIKAASHVGVKVLNLFTGPNPWNSNAPRIGRDMTEEKAWSLVLEAYRVLIEEAEHPRLPCC